MGTSVVEIYWRTDYVLISSPGSNCLFSKNPNCIVARWLSFTISKGKIIFSSLMFGSSQGWVKQLDAQHVYIHDFSYGSFHEIIPSVHIFWQPPSRKISECGQFIWVYYCIWFPTIQASVTCIFEAIYELYCIHGSCNNHNRWHIHVYFCSVYLSFLWYRP